MPGSLPLELLLLFFAALTALGLALWRLRTRAAPALEQRVTTALDLHRQSVAALLATLARTDGPAKPELRARLLANLRYHRDQARRLGAGAELAEADAALAEGRG